MMTVLLDPTLVTATSGLLGLFVIAASLLSAWNGWLDLKRRELERAGQPPATDQGAALGSARIELADLKERIRKLEAIASGVDL